MKTLIKLMESKGIKLIKNLAGNYEVVIGTVEEERLSGVKKVKRYLQISQEGSRYFIINQMNDKRFNGTLKEMKEYINSNY